MASDETSANKRQKSSKDVPYHLIYWPGLPGRGEYIRLALEAGGANYTDTAHQSDGAEQVMAFVQGKISDDGINPPPLAPPILRHGDLVISQTPNILLYLAPKLNLLPPNAEDDPDALYHINALVLTALDGLSNEVHDCHHPIATGLYYEDQVEEAKRRSKDYVTNRLPKFLRHFERVLESKSSKGGKWLYGNAMTTADLVLFQCIDGVKFMFTKAMANMEKEGKYEKVFALYKAVQESPRIKEYLASERRQKYGMGIYRHYDELDLEAEN